MDIFFKLIVIHSMAAPACVVLQFCWLHLHARQIKVNKKIPLSICISVQRNSYDTDKGKISR